MKRILCLSDIHLDINSQEKGTDLLPTFITYIQKQAPDVVLISGDISNDWKTSINILDKLMESIEADIRFIPGNHDIWVSGDKSSWTAYEQFKAHPTSLINKPYVIGSKHVLIGDMGWYDYSFGTETIPHSLFAQQKKRLWADGMYAKWQMDDIELFEKQYSNLDQQFSDYSDKRIIFANHFVPFEDFIKVSHTNDDWNFCNAYMGSRKLGELIKHHPNIDWCIFGHTHQRFGVIENHNGVNIICNPLGYSIEWSSISFEKELEKVGSIILIED